MEAHFPTSGVLVESWGRDWVGNCIRIIRRLKRLRLSTVNDVKGNFTNSLLMNVRRLMDDLGHRSNACTT
ncbi:hypothetical protein M0802_012910 [Mischocyttarus mexicanus]|nr:hypothetical protein M0802_012910 [Mischocyttarus mexicanus]